MDGRCLRARLRRPVADDGGARRPVRSGAGPPGRARGLRRRVDRGDVLDRGGPPDPRAHRDGHRWRADHAVDAVGHRQRLPARGAGEGHHDLGRRVGSGCRPRPARSAVCSSRTSIGAPCSSSTSRSRSSRWSSASSWSPRAATRRARRSTFRVPCCRSAPSPRSSTGSSRRRPPAGPTPCILASFARRDRARCRVRLARDPHAAPDARSRALPRPPVHRRRRRDRADVLRAVRGDLRADPVPAVHPRQDRAGGRDDDGDARPRDPARRPDQPQGDRARRRLAGDRRGAHRGRRHPADDHAVDADDRSADRRGHPVLPRPVPGQRHGARRPARS